MIKRETLEALAFTGACMFTAWASICVCPSVYCTPSTLNGTSGTAGYCQAAIILMEMG